jgi:ABC-2 type transport system ATP-binding protein
VDIVVDAHGLRKNYRKREAVAGLDLAIPRGCVYGILGPNGAGKTTTIHMLLGLVRPTGGTARVLGRPPGDRSAMRRIGFQPEQTALYPFLTASEYLHTMGSLSGVPHRDLPTRVAEAIQLSGLMGRSGDRIGTFSHGMRQRVGLAQAILHQPEILVLDEPTNGLDPIGRRDVRNLILHLKERGTTVLLNSHLLSEVEQTCDEVAILKDGRVIRSGTLDDLTADGSAIDVEVEEMNEAGMTALRAVTKKLRMQGMPPRRFTVYVDHADDAADIARVLVENGVRLLALTPRRESLEDLFVRVVEGTGDGGQGAGAR